MRDVFETVRLVLIVRQFNFLLIFDDLQRLFPESFEVDTASHQSICKIPQFLLIDHLISVLFVNDSLDA